MASHRLVATSLTGVACAVLLLLPWGVSRTEGIVRADQHVRIDSPADGASVTGRIDIRVTVAAPESGEIDFYRIYVGDGRSPTAMRPLGPPRTAPAENEVVATLDTTLLLAGDATIELRMYPKGGDPINATVVVMVQVGPTPTRTFSGPAITVPPVAVAPPPPVSGNAAPAPEYPVSTLPDVEIPQFAPIQPTPIPIQRLTMDNVYDTLPTDPVQDDPIYTDLPPTPIPVPALNLTPIPR